MNIIEMINIRKTYDQRDIFADFNLKVKEGEMLAIHGKSGSGKSTLLNIMGLIESYDEGELRVFGENKAKVNSNKATSIIRNKISYLFQNFGLIDEETVEENLVICLHHVKISKEQKKRKIVLALEKVNLAKELQTKIYQLSGGEQQRIAVARLFLKPAELILADEPTGSLDKDNRDKILGLLKDLNRLGKTIVIVSHDETVIASCQRKIEIK